MELANLLKKFLEPKKNKKNILIIGIVMYSTYNLFSNIDNIFAFDVLLSLALIVTIDAWRFANYYKSQYEDQIKFYAHVTFGIMQVYLCLALIYNIFYFIGFVKLLIIAVLYFSYLSIRNKVIEKVNNPKFTTNVTELEIIFGKILPYLLNIILNFLTYISNIFSDISIELGNNTQSIYYYGLMKNLVISKGLPVAMKYGQKQMFQKNNIADMFADITKMTNINVKGESVNISDTLKKIQNKNKINKSEENAVKQSSETYKNIPTNNNSNNMDASSPHSPSVESLAKLSVLKNSAYDEDLIDDDLDDEVSDGQDTCIDNCLKEIETKTKTIVNKPEIITNKPVPVINSQEENRRLLRQKINEKKSGRLGYAKTNNNTKDTSMSPSNVKGMSAKELQTILERPDNLEILLKEFPIGENGKPQIDPEKLKLVMSKLKK